MDWYTHRGFQLAFLKESKEYWFGSCTIIYLSNGEVIKLYSIHPEDESFVKIPIHDGFIKIVCDELVFDKSKELIFIRADDIVSIKVLTGNIKSSHCRERVGNEI